MARTDKDSWGAVADANTPFHNLPSNPLHAGLLAIEFEGSLYWDLWSPFGWTLAPFSWCHVSSLIQHYCALHRHNIIVYVDDFLILAQSKQATAVSQAFLIQLLVCLGLKDKPSKQIPPARSIPFIGFIVDFLSHSVHISDKQATFIHAEIKHTLEKKWVSSMSLRSLASKLLFVSQAVLGGCTFSRWIFDACTLQGHKRPLSQATCSNLNWWLKYLSTFNGCCGAHWAVFHPWAYLATDASSLGAAGICFFPHSLAR
jgi:hypothetical protein